MKAVTKLMIGAAGIAALGVAAPASAQYYPGYGYGYGSNPGNVIGQVIGQILNPYGANQYGYRGMNPQAAAQRCSAAVQQRLQMQYQAGYGGYGGYSGYGYNNGYSNARVLGITRVEQRSSTTTRVRGYATSGLGYGYGYGNSGADLTFKCDIDYRGYIRDIDIDRRY